jgi:hypothetical protein
MALAPIDTDPAALEVMTRLYRRMSPAQKLARVRDLTLSVARFALAGLRARHPQASEGELLLRLAELRLGRETTARVYGPMPDEPGRDDA